MPLLTIGIWEISRSSEGVKRGLGLSILKETVTTFPFAFGKSSLQGLKHGLVLDILKQNGK